MWMAIHENQIKITQQIDNLFPFPILAKRELNFEQSY